jgi:hypothetical protein
MQSVPITTDVVWSNSVDDEVHSIQHYVIKFVSGRWFYPGTPVSSTKNTDRHDITEILLKLTFITTNQTVYIDINAIIFQYVLIAEFFSLEGRLETAWKCHD